jgi:hypothetical protein
LRDPPTVTIGVVLKPGDDVGTMMIEMPALARRDPVRRRPDVVGLVAPLVRPCSR